jgi:signal transduction histidine kinase
MTKEKLDLPTQLDVTEFISKEAHDLKSPFNRILGFTKIVLKGMDGPLTDMQKEDLTIAYENSSQAMTLMSNLVDMARLSRGEKVVTPTECELKALLAQVAAYWKQNKAVKDVELELVTPEQEVKIQADEALLRQGILNWIVYIVEYAQPPARITVTLEERENEALFAIQSQGKKKGATSEIDMTMSAYIGQAIINLHKGSILLAEGDEEGAQVRFSLPHK